LEKGRVTAKELSEKFEVSIRTIYRDIDSLSSAGIPIYALQGKGGGIEIAKEFVLSKSLLSEDEKKEQAELRKEYIESIRNSLRADLNNISILNSSDYVEYFASSF